MPVPSVGPLVRGVRRAALALPFALTAGAVAASAPLACAQPAPGAATDAAQPGGASFAALVERLSESGGYFDTDNLISNERSYLHVVGALRARGVRGGAYVGVGPDQSFSYIAHVRPEVAFIVDIRRDNLLQHLLFKTLFARARNRLEYLALLTGRPVPDDLARWTDAPIERIVERIDATPASEDVAADVRAEVRETVRRTGVRVTPEELATIDRLYGEFVTHGLGLRYTSHGRPPRPHYPTLRQLVLERDLDGALASYLAREDDFRFVQRLQARDLVIPVVGDLSGGHALAAVGREIATRGLAVSALYTSNVEQYLMRDGTFDRFARTAAALPRNGRSVVIRSYFGGGHPQNVAGYHSTQLLQSLDAFAAAFAAAQRAPAGDGRGSYWDLVTRDHIDLRARTGR